MKFRKFEIALAAGLLCAVIAAVSAEAAERDLAAKMVRLHVVAAGDSAEDQALKLKVRDAVLAAVEPGLTGTDSREEAVRRLETLLPAAERAARDTIASEGYTYSVTIALESTDFPTKEYTSFALPAGEYCALRVVIGGGGGQNWWCVVFPPLCTAASLAEFDSAAEAGALTEEQKKLITRDGESYVIRFKVLEWWSALKKRLKARQGTQ